MSQAIRKALNAILAKDGNGVELPDNRADALKKLRLGDNAFALLNATSMLDQTAPGVENLMRSLLAKEDNVQGQVDTIVDFLYSGESPKGTGVRGKTDAPADTPSRVDETVDANNSLAEPPAAAADLVISPTAKALAEKNGIDLESLRGKGTGKNGKITQSDVQTSMRASRKPSGDAAATPPRQKKTTPAAASTEPQTADPVASALYGDPIVVGSGGASNVDTIASPDATFQQSMSAAGATEPIDRTVSGGSVGSPTPPPSISDPRLDAIMAQLERLQAAMSRPDAPSGIGSPVDASTAQAPYDDSYLAGLTALDTSNAPTSRRQPELTQSDFDYIPQPDQPRLSQPRTPDEAMSSLTPNDFDSGMFSPGFQYQGEPPRDVSGFDALGANLRTMPRPSPPADAPVRGVLGMIKNHPYASALVGGGAGIGALKYFASGSSPKYTAEDRAAIEQQVQDAEQRILNEGSMPAYPTVAPQGYEPKYKRQ